MNEHLNFFGFPLGGYIAIAAFLCLITPPHDETDWVFAGFMVFGVITATKVTADD